MQKQQKRIITNFIIVITITGVAVIAMINLKEVINRMEAKRAMEHLSQNVLKYRKTRGSVPPESYINEIKGQLEGNARLGEIYYRARWIDFDSPPDDILAYTKTAGKYLFFDEKYLILRLNGHVEWLSKNQAEKLLAQQQSQAERLMIQEKLKK